MNNRVTKWQWGLYEVAGIPEAFPGKTCRSLTHKKFHFMGVHTFIRKKKMPDESCHAVSVMLYWPRRPKLCKNLHAT